MSDEIIWEPQSVADLASQLSRLGNEYRNAIADIYNSFNSIGAEQKWVGKNYNVIANTILNSSKGTFEGWANYLQITVPQVVYQIAEAEAEKGGGSVYFSITPNSADIPQIQETVEKADGSQIVDPSAIRADLNGPIPSGCDNADTCLQRYYSQFEELGTLNNNSGILEAYNQLEGIISSSRNVLRTFVEEVKNASEKSIQKTELTNQETIDMANRLSSLLGM